MASYRAPQRQAWNVQVFPGLSDPDARRLQRRLVPGLHRGSPASGQASVPQRRRSRWQQVNAYGPRANDRLEAMLRDVEISRHGHVALNDIAELRRDPDGPVVWHVESPAPAAFLAEALRLVPGVPLLVHVGAGFGRRAQKALARTLSDTRGATLAPPASDPYQLLEGACALLAPPGPLALEAYCMGMPVALTTAAGARLEGLDAELAERVPRFAPGDGLRAWAESPPADTDTKWVDDLLYAPRPSRNDAFAAALREKAVAMAL